jgi:hypothetical protein
VSALLSYLIGLDRHTQYLSACALSRIVMSRRVPLAFVQFSDASKVCPACFSIVVRFSIAEKTTSLLHFTRPGVHSR